MYQYRIQQLLVFETEKSKFGGMIINPILLKILFFLIKEVYINMELRLLRYFLTVAKEQSFTKAAEQLHITQPTLSRQMAAFEEELGVTLFIRSGKKISLTEEGILLKRRALEILNLEEKTLEELKGKEDVVEGTITIGCGEFAAVETLAEICKTYKEKYPLVQIVLHTATADTVYEMMNKGLVDIALFLEPVDTEGLDYIWITDSSLKYHLQNAKNHGVTQKEMVFPIGAPNDGFAPYFPAEVKHWHGAAPDEWFSHLAVNDSNSANQIAHRTHHVSW